MGPRSRWCLPLLIGGLSVVPARPARTQTQAPPPITSNRPGISESEALLMPRAWQVESGVSVAGSTDEGVGHTQWTVPELTLRVGLTPRVELFLNATGFLLDVAREAGGDVTSTGGSDVQLNAKLGLLTEGPNLLTLSVAAGVSFPTGATAFSSGGYDPSLRLLWSRNLPRDWYIDGNLVLSDTTIEERRSTAGGASIGIGHPMSAATSWFVEFFGNITQRESSLWRLNGGVAKVIGADLQLDLSAGRAVMTDPGAWFVSAGISYRFRCAQGP